MSLVDEQPRTRVVTQPAHLEPRRRRRWPAVVAAAMVALLSLVVLGMTHGQAPAERRQPPSQNVGFAHSVDGASKAAVSYGVAYGSADMFDGVKRHAIVSAIADPVVEPQLQTRLDQAFEAVMATFGLDSQGRPPAGETFVARTVPVGVHVDQYDGNTAQVSIWATGLIGLTGTGSTKPVSEAWSTATLTLHWTDNDWKWVGFTQVDGPTPIGGSQPASGSEAITAAAREFGAPAYAR